LVKLVLVDLSVVELLLVELMDYHITALPHWQLKDLKKETSLGIVIPMLTVETRSVVPGL
jgi:hypothetical protein